MFKPVYRYVYRYDPDSRCHWVIQERKFFIWFDMPSTYGTKVSVKFETPSEARDFIIALDNLNKN